MNLNFVFRNHLLSEIKTLDNKKYTGRPKTLSNEEALSIIFKVLRTGMQWREIDSSVSYATVFRRMQQWQHANIFQNAFKRVLKTYNKLNPTKYYCIDSSYVKNQYGRSGLGKNHTDRGRKAIKLSLIVDQNGVSYGMRCDPGNRPDVTLLRSTLESMMTTLETLPLFADRGYDSRNNRNICQEYRVQDRIFRRKTKTVRRTNSKRIVVEHAFAWLDNFRRLIRFYEHTPEKYLNYVFLALGHHLCNRFSIGQNLLEKY